MHKLYDKYNGLKESFLNQYKSSDGTFNNYLYVLESCAEKEYELEKDVFEFTYDELGELWSSFKAKSYTTLQSMKSVVGLYVQHAINEGYSKTQINLVNAYKPKDMRKYVNKFWEKNKIFTRDEIYSIVSHYENPQDVVAFALIFEGAWGNNMEELTNLEVNDVNYNTKEIKLKQSIPNTNKYSERIIKVSEECMDIIFEASNQTEYYPHIKTKKYGADIELYDVNITPYVIRNLITKFNPDINNDKVSHQVIRQRMQKIKNSEVDNKNFRANYINPTNIRLSGMVEFVKKYMKKHSKHAKDLTPEEYRDFSVRFGGTDKLNNTIKERIYPYIQD